MSYLDGFTPLLTAGNIPEVRIYRWTSRFTPLAYIVHDTIKLLIYFRVRHVIIPLLRSCSLALRLISSSATVSIASKLSNVCWVKFTPVALRRNLLFIYKKSRARPLSCLCHNSEARLSASKTTHLFIMI